MLLSLVFSSFRFVCVCFSISSCLSRCYFCTHEIRLHKAPNDLISIFNLLLFIYTAHKHIYMYTNTHCTCNWRSENFSPKFTIAENQFYRRHPKCTDSSNHFSFFRNCLLQFFSFSSNFRCLTMVYWRFAKEAQIVVAI